MGRIKTQLIKRVTLKLYSDHKDDFTADYADNKKKIEKLLEVSSKKLRNIIAGYVTRLAKVDQR